MTNTRPSRQTFGTHARTLLLRIPLKLTGSHIAVADVLYGGREGLFQFNNVASITTRTADGVVSLRNWEAMTPPDRWGPAPERSGAGKEGHFGPTPGSLAHPQLEAH
jgi:hypothetical protein